MLREYYESFRSFRALVVYRVSPDMSFSYYHGSSRRNVDMRRDIKIGKWSIEGSGLLFFIKSVYLFLLNIGKPQHPEIRPRKLNNKGNFNPLYNNIIINK